MTFKKGQSGNPKGRRPRVTEDKYLALMKSAISEVDWVKATKAILHRAECGDVAAWKALAEYMYPKPAQRTELTGEAGGPVKLKVVYEDRTKRDDA